MIYQSECLHNRCTAYVALTRQLLNEPALDRGEQSRRKALANLLCLWTQPGSWDAAAILILADTIAAEAFITTKSGKTYARIGYDALRRAIGNDGAAELAIQLSGFYLAGTDWINKKPGDDGPGAELKLEPGFAADAVSDWTEMFLA